MDIESSDELRCMRAEIEDLRARAENVTDDSVVLFLSCARLMLDRQIGRRQDGSALMGQIRDVDA